MKKDDSEVIEIIEEIFDNSERVSNNKKYNKIKDEDDWVDDLLDNIFDSSDRVKD